MAKKQGNGDAGEPVVPPESETAAESAPQPAIASGRAGPRLAALLAVLLPIAVFLFGRGAAPSPASKSMTVLVEAPYLAELVNDSTMIDYLMRAGVRGVVLKPATVGSIMEGRDVAMASGAEILRLFRMEGIVNIWMWEQIKDQPIRPEATYIFTNQLNTFETLLATLQQNLGAMSVRSYRDATRDFGGDVPGNYIIEALAPIDELRSIAIGLDRTYRERLAATGIVPVIEIASADDVKALPVACPAILATSSGAADAAYARLRPSEVYLGRGVTNPGWPEARLAVREDDADSFSAPQNKAIIARTSDVLGVINNARATGFVLAGATPRRTEPGSDDVETRDRMRPLLLALLAAYGAWFLLWGACESRFDRRSAIILAAYGVVAAIVAALRGGPAFQEYFAMIVPALFAAGAARRAREISAEETAWLSAIAVAAALLSAALMAAGRPAPSTGIVVLIAAAVACLLDASSSANPILVAVVALAAADLLPRSALMAGVLLPVAALPVVARSRRRVRDAALILAAAASLVALTNSPAPPALRLAHALFLFVALFFLMRLARIAAAD